MPRPEAPCRLKAGRYSLPILHFNTAEADTLRGFLQQQMERARALLEDAAILLAPAETLSGLDTAAIQHMVETCRQERLYPVGLAQCEAAEAWQAKTDLRILHAGLAQVSKPEEAPAGRSCDNRLIDRPVRSGQQAMAARGSLTVLASVSATAEVLARDDIHILGALKGKALAGIQGNEQARIICRRFEAELVAVAGHYRLFDEPDPELFGKSVCISLQDDQLNFQVYAER